MVVTELLPEGSGGSLTQTGWCSREADRTAETWGLPPLLPPWRSFFFLNCEMHVKCTILAIFNARLSVMNYTHIVV